MNVRNFLLVRPCSLRNARPDIDFQKKIADFVHENSSLIGIQLAHAGRKASTAAPFVPGPTAVSDAEGTFSASSVQFLSANDHSLLSGGWTPVGPSETAWDAEHRKPHELSKAEIQEVLADFVAATKRAITVGYDVVEIHAAHGYLLTSFLSPLSNKVRS